MTGGKKIRSGLRGGTPRRAEASFARGATLAIFVPVIAYIALAFPVHAIAAAPCKTYPQVAVKLSDVSQL